LKTLSIIVKLNCRVEEAVLRGEEEMEKTQEKSIEDRGDLDVWIVREDPRDNKQKVEKNGVSNGMSSCVIPDGSIFLYGGESAPLDSLESFEYSKCFDTQSLKWRNITCIGDLPRRRR